MMGWYGHGMGLGGWFVMGLIWIALVGAAVWLALRPRRSGPSAAVDVESPEEILDRRLATGDIDEQTYAQRRSALTTAHGADSITFAHRD
jgi:putative membrane protein